MSALDDIWKEVNERVAEKLPAIVLEKAAARHTNNHLGRGYDGCECEYCRLRIQMSAYVGNAGRSVTIPAPADGMTPPFNDESISLIIDSTRKYRRDEARRILREARGR